MMDLLASGLAILVSLLWLMSLLLSVKFGSTLMSKTDMPVMEKLHIFGFFVFSGQGIIVALYFLISLLPFESQCYSMFDCQLIGILDGIKEQHRAYGVGALVAFAIAFFHFKNIGKVKNSNSGTV